MKKFVKFLIDSFDYEKNARLAKTRPPVVAKDLEHLYKLIQKEINLYGNKCSLNHIDVSNVGDMSHLFRKSKFNGDISQWNTTNVSDMSYMFNESKFNGDISKWNVSNVKNMNYMFKDSLFNKDISDWKPYKKDSFFEMFENSKIKIPYWAEYEDIEDRKRAIDRYHLNKELNSDLIIKDGTTKKKLKI